MSNRLCKNCQYFDRFDSRENSNGLCRINPPKLIDSLKFGEWPAVTSKDWCGKFSKVIPPMPDVVGKKFGEWLQGVADQVASTKDNSPFFRSE